MYAVLLLLLAAAIAQDTMSAQTHGGNALPFQAVFRIADTVGVQYQIQNTRSRPIYLFNVLWDFDQIGNYVKAPSPAYVCIKGGRGVHVAQMILPLPKKAKVELRIVPFVTKVEPGQTYTGSFALPIPVKEFNSYFPETPQSKTEEITAEAVIFTLQFIEDAPGAVAKPSPIGEGLMLDHPNLFGALQTLQSQPNHTKFKALKRTDHFEDF